jgi:hypothetical protein
MKFRLAYLIQAVFAVLVAGGLSFGASRAMASPQAAAAGNCPKEGYDYEYYPCGERCPWGIGYCASNGYCACGFIP